MNSKVVYFKTNKTGESVKVESENASLKDRIIAAMRTVYDPEIPVNIYDLGLIYDIQIDEQKKVSINMTLTAPGCPVAGILPRQVECAVKEIEQVSDCIVTLVWDPPWTQDRLSDEARLELGMF